MFGILSALWLAGCGGGGGGSSGGAETSISIEPQQQIVFQQIGVNGFVEPKTVHVRFVGDGVVAGYAPGVAQAGWLSVSDAGNTTANSADFLLSVLTINLPTGTYTTSLRFATGRTNGSGDIYSATQIKTVDVPISLKVSDLAAVPTSFGFEAVESSNASPAPEGQHQFWISASQLNWTASSDQGWLVLSQTAGTEPTAVPFTLNTGGLSRGEHVAHITVRNPPTGETQQLTVAVTVRAPRLTLSRDAIDTTIGADSAAAALQLPLRVSDELQGLSSSRAVSWRISGIDQPWLSASVSTGTTSPPKDIQLQIDAAQLAQLSNGTHQAQVTFTYSNVEVQNANVVLPVSLQLALPRATQLAPYVAITGSPSKVLLRGSGFTRLTAAQVSCGGVAATAIEILRDTLARVVCQPATPGRYRLSISNLSGVNLSTPELLVRAPQVRPYAAFEVSGHPGRLIFDQERETLYVVNVGNSQLERYRYDGMQWQSLPAIPVNALLDGALSYDGKKLYVLTASVLQEAALDAPQFSLTPRSESLLPEYPSEEYFRMGIALDGMVVLTTTSRYSSGFYSTRRYTLPSGPLRTFSTPVTDDRARVFSSADGGSLYTSGYSLNRYDDISKELPRADSFDRRIALMNSNRDGSRLLQGGSIYAADLSLIGDVSNTGVYAAFGAQSGRIYAFHTYEDDPDLGQNLLIVDGNGAVQDGLYPEITRIALPDSPNMGIPGDLFYLYALPVEVSTDERSAFVQGFSRLVIVPVP
ncbi:hypothetical protein B1810_07625 [Panacagrimonas perspica]|nr:BACON domain-containing protein [Panacagrimonas perspica]THD04107.1 hypothetical protein B1810_07625 [Panacagrimonas perspica]